jgi:PAS domain S-box-containing protein
LKTPVKRIEADDPRMIAGTAVWIAGGIACFLELAINYSSERPSSRIALLVTGLTLLALIPIYRRTRNQEFLLGIGAVIAMLWSLTPFLMTGNVYYLSLGISLPITATICGSTRLGIVSGCVFMIAGLGSAIALEQKWIFPSYSSDELLRGYVSESIAIMIVMLLAWLAGIWVEHKARKAEAIRSQSEVSLQKQLDGLKILAETTEQLLTTDVQPEGWLGLLNRFAKHLDCDIITNYEFVGDKLHLRACTGMSADAQVDYQEIKLGEKVCGLCAQTRKTIYLDGKELEASEQGAALYLMGIKTVVSVPLLYGKQLVGTLAFGSTLKNSLSIEEVDFAKMVGQFVASIRGREQANAAKNEATKRLEKLASRLPGVVYQFRLRPDGSFCFPYASERMFEIHGVHPEEIVEDGSKVLEFHHPDDSALFLEKIRLASKEAGPFLHEFRLKFGDGTIRWVSIDCIPEFESDGSVLFHGYAADVTNRLHAQQSLLAAHAAAEYANRAKTEFLANMSHEIRTPMTAILGYADILAEEPTNALSQVSKAECIETIKRNGQHLLSIINDILDISKIEADKLLVEKIAVSPLQIAQDVLELMKLKAQAKGLVLTMETTTPVPKSIQTDPTRLRQILVNLIGNAIKFTELGSITLSIHVDREKRSQLCFDIIDTGIGIDKEQITKLFRPFEQADASTTRKFGGTGLGLQISKRLAEILGGDIQVTSEPGSGSVFSLTIATGDLDEFEWTQAALHVDQSTTMPSVQRSPSDQVSQSSQLPLRGVRVLSVEDGVDNQRLISFHLSKAGAVVDIASNGRLAVEKLCIGGSIDQAICLPPPIDIVLMDMQMPEMDGYQATQILRSKGFSGPILALTAHAMEADQFKCLEAGCDVWLTKPIEKSELIRVCQKWVGGFAIT